MQHILVDNDMLRREWGLVAGVLRVVSLLYLLYCLNELRNLPKKKAVVSDASVGLARFLSTGTELGFIVSTKLVSAS